MQNWIAKGCPKWAGKPLGGFESHNRIIGGILETAGIMGFLANRVAMQEVGRVDSPEDMLMDAMIAAGHAVGTAGTIFRVWNEEKPPQTAKGEDGATSPAPYAGWNVESIRNLLQTKGIALAHSGYAKRDDGDVFYPDSAKTILAGRIGAMAGAVREWTEAREEVEARRGRYVFQKAGNDKHGTLYRLEMLKL